MRIYSGDQKVETKKLTAFEKRLCNALQNGLPIVKRPYAALARALKSTEESVLKKTQGLVRRGIIRRLGAVVNWRAIGMAGTLAAAHIEKDDLYKVVEAVNRLDGVSHNYLRDHHFNLWFTLRADSEGQINKILSELSRRFGVKFYSLPAVRIFKLDVRFDAQSGGRRLLPGAGRQKTEYRRQKTDRIDERILSELQNGLKVVAEPFKFLCKGGTSMNEVASRLKKMLRSGAILRIGAVVSHHKLGFVANALFVCRESGRRAVEVGRKLTGLDIVSHCYQRRTFNGWPYNLFAMMHGRSMKDIQGTVKKFVKAERTEDWKLLVTKERLRK